MSLLTTRQAAGHLGVSPETILRRVRAGELVAYRIATNALRFRPDDLEAYLAARREGSAPNMREAGFPASEPLADANVNGKPTAA
jgi:excisionase family DNA binding protein